VQEPHDDRSRYYDFEKVNGEWASRGVVFTSICVSMLRVAAPDIDLAAVFDVTDLLLPVRERPFIPLVLFALASLVS
jgi:hypothetical protein